MGCVQLTKDVLPVRSWYHHPGPIHDELIGDPKVVADCKKWTERIIDPAFVRWKAVLNRFPKLSVVRVPVSFLLEPCNVRVFQESVELVTRSGVLVSLEQHRVSVNWGLEVGFFINRVWVVDWVAGETVNDFVVDARPPDCCEAIQGQFFLQVDHARGRQFVERLGVEDGDKGTMVDHQLKVGACKIEVRLVDGPDDCEQFDLCGGVA